MPAESLDSVPAEARISEEFGVLPGVLGVVGIVSPFVLIAFADPSVRGSWQLWAMCVGLLAFGALCMRYELTKRAHAMALVTHDGSVSLYRDGKLSDTVPRNEVRFYRYNHINTFGCFFCSVMAAVFLYMRITTHRAVDGPFSVGALGTLVCAAAAIPAGVLLAWSRIRFVQYMLLVKSIMSARSTNKTQLLQEFEMTRASARQLFS